MSTANREPESFGQRLRAARKAAKLPLRDAAKALGCAINTLSWYEAGSREPKAGFITEAAKLYGVPVSFFFGEKPIPDDVRAAAERIANWSDQEETAQ